MQGKLKNYSSTMTSSCIPPSLPLSLSPTLLLSLSVQSDRAPFSYGAGARADRQLKALAVISQVALQTVSHSCSKSSQPIRMVGWNGQELPIREYSWSINYELDSDLRCKV